MANPSLQIGNDNWAIKEDNLLGYSTAGTRFVPQPITMTRASAGTRVNSSGLVETVELLGSEEVDCGDFECAVPLDYWSNTGTNTSVLDGNLVFNGNSANTWAIQSLFSAGLYNGKILKITYTISENTLVGSGDFRRGGYSGSSVFPSSSNLNTTVGTHTEYIIVNSSGNNNALDLWITSGYTSGNLKISNISVKESTKNNLARVDYDGTASSLLAEPQRTNLITYSEDFSQSYWTKQSGVTPTYNTTETLSPDGTYNATKFIGNGSSGVLKGGISVTGVIARSVYLKSITGTVNVVLKDPNLTVTQKTLTVTEEWQRFELIESNGTSTQGIWIDDIPASGIYVYGAQVEEGSYATSYIPTDGSTVTRVQDQYSKTGISNLINSTEGVLFVEMAALADDGTNRFISISNGNLTDRVVLYYNSVSNRISSRIVVGGTSKFLNADSQTQTNFNKIAIKWKLNDYALWINGFEVDTDTSGSTFTSGTLNNLSFNEGDGSDTFFGKVKQLQVYNTALTDTELATLTTI